jgi:hypothetical protein
MVEVLRRKSEKGMFHKNYGRPFSLTEFLLELGPNSSDQTKIELLKLNAT